MSSLTSRQFVPVAADFLRKIATDSERTPTLYFSKYWPVRVFFWMRLRLIFSLMRRFTCNWTCCLDFGGGGGVFLPSLASAFQRVVCVDFNTVEASAVSREYRLTNVELVQADIRDAGFAPGTFPNIVAADVLEHFAELSVPIATLRAWLAPGGLLFTSLPTENTLYVLLRVMFGISKPADHYHSAAGVEHFLEANGFRRLRSRYVPLYAPILPLFRISAWQRLA